MTTPYFISRRKFRKWLELYSPDSTIGRARHTSNCPIAEFLRDTKAADPTAVSVNGAYIHLGVSNFIRTPLWVQKFLTLLDTSVLGEVTAATALNILDRRKPYYEISTEEEVQGMDPKA